MELKHWLLILQITLLGLQIGSGVYASSQGIRPTEFWGGFPVWGCVPIIALMLVIWSL